MAYTKYSLTPANNTATPPDGAPEGMLPSAVNDTMRDMMAQIRDCGDGIRDGTYTMTAPKITGGTITGVAFTGNTFTSPVISGGSINNTPIGATTANTGAFTTLSASSTVTFTGLTASQAVFTNASDELVSNAITGSGNVVMSASPTLTGTITAAAITASSTITGNGNWVIGNADTDTITIGASFVTGSVLRSAKSATNTLALAAYDVDGAAYTDLITLTASNTPTLALTSTGVGTINNMSIGATTRSTGAFTTLTSNGATTFTAGTASTTTGTGTLVITGGLGVSGRINATNFDGIVGANTAAAGSFTALSATGVTTVQAGTVSAPAITTSGDTNTGIFFPAADTIAFAEGGVESMRIDSSGRLGIGTSSPSSILTVNGRLTLSGVGTSELYTSDSSGMYLTAATSGGLYIASDNYTIFRKATTPFTEYMRIDSSGNVGIGTTAPANILELKAATPIQIFNQTTGNSNQGIQFQVNGSTYGRMFFNSVTGQCDTRAGLNNGDGYYLTYSTDGSERMRITSGGFLFVGTTALVGDGHVSVSFNGSSNVGMGLKSTHNGSFDVMRFINYNNVQQGYINCNNSGSTTYNSGSDYRLKDNVQLMVDGLSKVMQLKPVTFNWKGDNSAGQGFIAHELAEIVPDVVSGEKDAVTEDGTIKPQGVDYGKLTAVLASAIQELNAKVEAQAAEIALLKSK